MYKEDYIISNSAERILPIISGSSYSGKPEKFTVGETSGNPVSVGALLAPPQPRPEEERDGSPLDARCGECRGGGGGRGGNGCVRRRHVQRRRDAACFQGHFQSQGTC